MRVSLYEHLKTQGLKLKISPTTSAVLLLLMPAALFAQSNELFRGSGQSDSLEQRQSRTSSTENIEVRESWLSGSGRSQNSTSRVRSNAPNKNRRARTDHESDQREHVVREYYVHPNEHREEEQRVYRYDEYQGESEHGFVEYTEHYPRRGGKTGSRGEYDKEHAKARFEQEKRQAEFERERRKRERELARENRKFQQEMERERRKHLRELEKERRKYDRELAKSH